MQGTMFLIFFLKKQSNLSDEVFENENLLPNGTTDTFEDDFINLPPAPVLMKMSVHDDGDRQSKDKVSPQVERHSDMDNYESPMKKNICISNFWS